ncbi:hypothetical protein [Desulfobulbus propionicus]
MKSTTKKPTEVLLQDSHDFSLVLGGPLFQLLRRSHLADDALLLRRQRILVISLFCWLPLLALSALESSMLGGNVTMPFLWDMEVHVRFLVVVPLLIVAEMVVHRRMRPLVQQFLERNVIPVDAMAQFDAALASAMRLRNSVLAEVLLVVFVYAVGNLFIWRQFIMVVDTATWYAHPSGEGMKFSFAGMWYAYASVPVFQFLLVRWYFRLFIWMRFLWQTSRIQLSLVPTHPDHLGGIGFLANTAYAFMPVLMAHGALLAGNLANRIFHLGAALPDFKMEILVLVTFLLAIVLGPLLVFAPQLAQAKRTGLREYGTVAERLVREFDTKWVRGGAPADELLVGNNDISSLGDLGSCYEAVRSMRIVPVTRDTIVQLAAATLVPFLPLMLTMMPLEELLKKLFGILF